MSCPDCTESQTRWTWGGYSADCSGCEIRAIASAPKRLREQRYAQVLASDGQESMDAYRKAVIAEYQRIDALRSKENNA